MVQFVAFDKDMEVSGEAIISVVKGMGVFKKTALEILASVGIFDPKPGVWYELQAWLDAFKIIASKIGSNTLYMIGLKIPENALWPPEIDTIEKALASIDVAYHMNHKKNTILWDPETKEMKEGIGHYGYELVAPKKVKMVCDNPYPCDFDRGIITAIARKFKPSTSPLVIVKHDDTQPCRKKGADSCTYWVEW